MSLDGTEDRANRPVFLNVGGKHYVTTTKTLNKYPKSLLNKLVDDRTAIRAPDGDLVVDRDGKLFRYILNFYRDGASSIPLHFGELEQLRLEAEYFHLYPMIRYIDMLREADETITVRQSADDVSVKGKPLNIYRIFAGLVKQEEETLWFRLLGKTNFVEMHRRLVGFGYRCIREAFLEDGVSECYYRKDKKLETRVSERNYNVNYGVNEVN
ncbi:unnamed protein product [Calicophoron daubneyi]|uniref:BTB domain-containing protein n=1 Tax=Calicophoron daubneyi TaxID=300641 RepID=A0AAV2TLA6_CALDB